MEQQQPNLSQILDAPFILPTQFEDFKTSFLQFGLSDKPLCFNCTVLSQPVFVNGPKPRAYFDVTDGLLKARATFFGSNYLLRQHPPKTGSRILLQGKVSTWQSYLQVTNPYLVQPHEIGRIVPRYRGYDADLPDRIALALDKHMRQLYQRFFDIFPGQHEREILSRADPAFFFGFDQLLEALHRPEALDIANEALMVATHLAALEVLQRGRRMQVGLIRPESVIRITPAAIDARVEPLPFTLTQDQSVALHKLSGELAEQKPMDALLSGDVGTGKTAVFGVLAAAAWQQGKRVAIMVPNELLARQIAEEFASWWPETKVQQVTGSSKKALPSDNTILIGTTALLNRTAAHGWIPDLLIVDEQHKYSEGQRSAMAGPNTNILEATATCIPRSAALVAFAGKCLCTLKQSPVVKQIRSQIYPAALAKDLLAELRQLIADGKQIAIVYPTVAEGVRGLKDWTSASTRWERAFPGRVALLNGRMKSAEKQAAIDSLFARDKDVLVTTSAIEVGLTLPDLAAVVVVHGEQFGISQLHQMRGRIARKGGTGLFAMYLPLDVEDDALERLHLLEQESDGFVLAEQDLELRGFGDLDGNGRQHGHGLSQLFPSVRLRPSDIRYTQKAEHAASVYLVEHAQN